MSDINHFTDFLDPISLSQISGDEGYRDGQIGKSILVYDHEFPALEQADIILVGCPEERGARIGYGRVPAPDAIRQQYYSLYNWHPEIRLADIGNIKKGASLGDSHAALTSVLRELEALGKTTIIIGGSHDLTLAQYHAFSEDGRIIEVVCADAKIDIDIDSPARADNFLMPLLTGEPNYIRHYSHIGFQSYFVHPGMLETMDKLRFDCFRVGHVKENIEEMEPVIRNASLVSIDISVIANAYAPSNGLSPNGLNGEEACVLARYAGLSPVVSSFGIYGYFPEKDANGLTAIQIAQMIWYFIDGRYRGQREATLEEKDLFNEYHTAFAEVETTFLQSKKTGRWWMQLPDKKFIACSYRDYVTASSNEIPERWLRAQERAF